MTARTAGISRAQPTNAGHGGHPASSMMERVGNAIVPPWVAPAEARVRDVRRRAAGWLEPSGGEVRYRGIIHALDWIAGVRGDSPVTEVDDEPTSGRVLVEVLAIEQAFRREPQTRGPRARRSAIEDEEQMERLGHGIHIAAVLMRNGTGRLDDTDIRFFDGVLDTLRWLLGETDRPPVALPARE